MKKWNWLFEKDEQGINVATCLMVIGVFLIILGFAGGIERGLLFP
ncbi:hypothetical protein [Jeotgalibaca porci]